MSDRLKLIARIGARLEQCEADGDELTAGILRDALGQLVEDASLVAAEEKRRAKDRNRKKGPAGNSSDSTDSADSTEAGTPPSPMVSLLPPEPPNNTSFPHPPEDPSSSGDGIPGVPAYDPDAPRGWCELDRELHPENSGCRDWRRAPDPAPGADDSPPSSRRVSSPLTLSRRERRQIDADAENAPPAWHPAALWGTGSPKTTPAIVRRAVDFVLAHYVERHPKRRPGDRDRKLVERHLRTYSPADLCAAIDGNADDDWAKGIGKHELSWTLRDNGKIDDYREKAERARASDEVVAAKIAETGWLPDEATR